MWSELVVYLKSGVKFDQGFFSEKARVFLACLYKQLQFCFDLMATQFNSLCVYIFLSKYIQCA